MITFASVWMMKIHLDKGHHYDDSGIIWMAAVAADIVIVYFIFG